MRYNSNASQQHDIAFHHVEIIFYEYCESYILNAESSETLIKKIRFETAEDIISVLYPVMGDAFSEASEEFEKSGRVIIRYPLGVKR